MKWGQSDYLIKMRANNRLRKKSVRENAVKMFRFSNAIVVIDLSAFIHIYHLKYRDEDIIK